VQTASSALFIVCCALLVPLFHKLFNKAVENFFARKSTGIPLIIPSTVLD
jgi:hypothetical protein